MNGYPYPLHFEQIWERATTGGHAGDGVNDGEPGHEGDCNRSEHEDNSGGNKQKRSQSIDTDDGSARQKINVDVFTWVVHDRIDPPSLSLSLLQTLTTLENFSQDPKLTKTLLLNSTQLPQFPESEWTNLIAGQAVDLDHILASQYLVSHDKRCTECIRELELVVGSAKPSHTNPLSFETTGGTSSNSFPASPMLYTLVSCNMTGSKQHSDKTSCSLTTTNYKSLIY
jgi:hypothetical protein